MALVLHAGIQSFLSPALHRLRITLLKVGLDLRLGLLIHLNPLRPLLAPKVVFSAFSAISLIPLPAATKAPVRCPQAPYRGLVRCPEVGILVPALIDLTNQIPGQAAGVPLTGGPRTTPEVVDEAVMVMEGGDVGIQAATTPGITITRSLIKCCKFQHAPASFPSSTPSRLFDAISIDWNGTPVSCTGTRNFAR